MKNKMFKGVSAALGLAATLAGSLPALAQTLYVSESQNDTVEAVSLSSGRFSGPLVHSSNDAGDYKITGPRGVVFWNGLCIVANQNANLPISGEVLAFDGATGAFVDAIVPFTDPNAPFAPRGVVVVGDVLYVADIGDFVDHPGQILMYDLGNGGAFVGTLNTEGFDKVFGPRGLAVGPQDGLLYVGVSGDLAVGDRASGHIARFDLRTGKYHDTFVSSDAPNGAGLHRPEGITFDSRGNLHVTTFLTGSDLDGIISYNAAGEKIGQVNFWAPGQARVYAQAVLVGPNDDLFAPLSNTTGVRRYLAATGYQNYTVLPAKGKAVREGWYLSFRETDPATLQYHAH